MKRYRSHIFGLFQIVVMLCIIGSLLVAALSIRVWREGIGLEEILYRFRQRRPSQVISGPPPKSNFALPIVTPFIQNTDFQPVTVTTTAILALTLPPPPSATVVSTIPTAMPAPIPRLSPTPFATPVPIPTTISAGSSASASPTVTLSPTMTRPLPTATFSSAVSSVDPVNHFADLPERQATRLVIPKIEIDAPVLLSPIVSNTWQVNHLGQAIGHLERTASPGDNNNVVLAAHITLPPDGRAGPFAHLNRLTPGDLVTVYHKEQPFFYRIDHLLTVKPDDVHVSYPSIEPKLTLITCLNYNPRLKRYEDRLVAVGYLEMEQ